jgi:hypothetical protein
MAAQVSRVRVWSKFRFFLSRQGVYLLFREEKRLRWEQRTTGMKSKKSMMPLPTNQETNLISKLLFASPEKIIILSPMSPK